MSDAARRATVKAMFAEADSITMVKPTRGASDSLSAAERKAMQEYCHIEQQISDDLQDRDDLPCAAGHIRDLYVMADRFLR